MRNTKPNQWSESTGGKVVLNIVAGSFIVFAVSASIWAGIEAFGAYDMAKPFKGVAAGSGLLFALVFFLAVLGSSSDGK